MTSVRYDSSVVWKFYDVSTSDSTKAVCQLCSTSVSRGGTSQKTFNTTNLRKHLLSKHKNELNAEIEKQKQVEMEREEAKRRSSITSFVSVSKKQKTDAASESSTHSTQLTIAESYERKKVWDINSSKAKIVHFKIAEMIAVDGQPISIVEDLGFNRLMKECLPNYHLPSRKYFAENIIPNIHSSLMEKVTSITKEAENISCTTDIWTNNSNTSFISLTGHCMNEKFDHTCVILRVKPFPGTHTAENIADAIRDSIDEFAIPKYKIHLIVRDNGANVVKGINETGHLALPCFLHTLQLVIHDAIFEQRVIKDIVTSCKKIVGHFSHSQVAYRKLEDLQKRNDLPQHKLIQDVQTRWNSTYFMIERLFEQKTAITAYCIETAGLPVLDANKWSLLGKLCKLLKVFHKTTVR